MDKVRIGVIGLGFGQFLVRTLAHLDDVQLVALADKIPNVPGGLDDYARRYGAAAYTDSADMLAHEQLDAVCVAVSPKWRMAIMEQVAARGLRQQQPEQQAQAGDRGHQRQQAAGDKYVPAQQIQLREGQVPRADHDRQQDGRGLGEGHGEREGGHRNHADAPAEATLPDADEQRDRHRDQRDTWRERRVVVDAYLYPKTLALIEDVDVRNGELLALSEQITCPVVAIHGDYDPHPAEGIEKPLAAYLGNFRFILLKNCGHKPWGERQARDEFYRVLGKELS